MLTVQVSPGGHCEPLESSGSHIHASLDVSAHSMAATHATLAAPSGFPIPPPPELPPPPLPTVTQHTVPIGLPAAMQSAASAQGNERPPLSLQSWLVSQLKSWPPFPSPVMQQTCDVGSHFVVPQVMPSAGGGGAESFSVAASSGGGTICAASGGGFGSVVFASGSGFVGLPESCELGVVAEESALDVGPVEASVTVPVPVPAASSRSESAAPPHATTATAHTHDPTQHHT